MSDFRIKLVYIALAIGGASIYYFYSKEPNSGDSYFKKENSLNIVNGSAFSDENTGNSKPRDGKNIQISANKFKFVSDDENYSDGDTYTKVVNIDNTVDGVRLHSVMNQTDFNSVIDKLSDISDKSIETIRFESRVNEYINGSKYNSLLNDYKVSCDNLICLGSFSSFSKEELNSFIDDFSNGKDSPMHKSGYVNYIVNEVEGVYEYRISFNSDPDVNAIVIPSK